MDVNDSGWKQKNMVNLKRKRKEEKKRNFVVFFSIHLLFYQEIFVLLVGKFWYVVPGSRDQRRKQKRKLKQEDE